MGTALTSEHLPLLRKGDPKVILAYDGDKAGVAAALKAAQMLSVAGFDGGVVLFPEGQDPADLIAKGESETVAKLLREAKPLIPFVLEMIVAQYDLNDPRAKEAAFGNVKQFLDTLSQIIKDAYIPMAATLVGISPSFFGKETNAAKAKESFTQNKDDSAYLQIIKTLIENPSLIDTVLNVMDVSMFDSYAPLLTALINGENENPGLVRLSLDDSLDILTEEKLNKELCALLLTRYNSRLKSIASSQQMPFEKKSFLIRKIRTDIIPRLKKGELVAFDSLN